MQIVNRLATPYRLIKDLALFAFDTLFLTSRKSSVKTSHLVVIKLDAIGDFVLWQSYADTIRKGFPNHQVTLVANALWQDLAKSLSHWDAIYAIDTRRFTRDLQYRKNVIGDVRALGAETVLHPTYSRHFSISDAIVRSSQANKRVGFRGDASNMPAILKRISDKFYTELIESDDSQSELHRSYVFMTKTCAPTIELKKPHLNIRPSTPATELPDGYFVLFPGAGSPGRRWPTEHFAEIAKRITSVTGLTPVVCGSRNEAELATLLTQSIPGPVCNLTDKTKLSELIAVIKRAEFVVTNETSAVHISAGVGTPVVCILGGGHFGRFLPYNLDEPDPEVKAVAANLSCFGCNWVCKYKVGPEAPKPCIEVIDVDSVWQAIQKLPQNASM